MQKPAIIFGINQYDPAVYGSGATLEKCVFDAERMFRFAIRNGYSATFEQDAMCRKANFLSYLEDFSKALQAGDRLLIYQSSHGTSVQMGQGQASGLCMYDGVLWDFELNQILRKFRRGVEITMVFDTCHSESTHRMSLPFAKAKFIQAPAPPPVGAKAGIGPTMVDKRRIRANYLHFAACQYDKYAYEIESGGVFTTSLLSVLQKNPGAPAREIEIAVKELCATYQTPVLDQKGPSIFKTKQTLI